MDDLECPVNGLHQTMWNQGNPVCIDCDGVAIPSVPPVEDGDGAGVEVPRDGEKGDAGDGDR